MSFGLPEKPQQKCDQHVTTAFSVYLVYPSIDSSSLNLQE
jgi:hypothetical protein